MPGRFIGKWTNSYIHRTVTDGPFSARILNNSPINLNSCVLKSSNLFWIITISQMPTCMPKLYS